MTSDTIPPEVPPPGENAPPDDHTDVDDHTEAKESPAPPAEKRRPGRAGRVVVSLVIVGVALVLAFAPAARLAAQGLPAAPDRTVSVVAGPQRGPATAVRAVPAGLPTGARIRTAADVLPYAVAALGRPDAEALMALLNARSGLAVTDQSYRQYPYQYPPLNAVLDRAPSASLALGGTALGAALTELAAQPQVSTPSDSNSPIENAGPAAYGVLNRVQAAGGCAAQLDLLLLLTADEVTMLDAGPSAGGGAVGGQERRAEAACPHDPTPGWLVGEAQLRMLEVSETVTDADPTVLGALHGAHATFSQLAAEYPRDPGVLTGLGDSYLRAGTYLMSSEPFTAQLDFRSAIAAYDRASALGDARDAAAGVARALIGLDQPTAAARLLAPLARSSSEPGELLELLIEADEASHDFTAAVNAAQLLEQRASAAYPDGDALIPVPLTGSIDPLDDVSFPLSFGAGRLTPLRAELLLPGGAGGSLQDLSFIPDYRDDLGVTGTELGCPSWSWSRDELLLGHAALALASWPAQFASVRPSGGYCYTSDELKLIAQTQAGQPPDQATLKADGLTSDDLADGWQNLLRWAGNLPAAKKAASTWQAARGSGSAMPALRLGEIDFLMHDYNDAAAAFSLAAHRWRLVSYNADLQVDQAELDQGAALFGAGRAAEAMATLRPLDLTGTEGYSYQNSSGVENNNAALQFATVSYYACEQLADYESETGNLHAAVDDYTNALAWVPQLESGANIRPEVLNNNAALAYLGLGETTTAAALENQALAADPKDPVFLMTAGFIADRSGQVAQAARYDRAALESDPGAFPAANDLSVELMRSHQEGEAVEALRQAVGANHDYALGWFNLGVVESRLGPLHVLDAQGAFAMAYSLDPALQGRQHQLTIDASVYRTALDLSKPLPPNWSIAQLSQPAPAAAAGLLALGLLALGLARAAGHGGSALAGQWLDPLTDRLQSTPLLRRLHRPLWSLAATAASFLFAYLRKGAGPTEVVTYVAGVVVLALVAVGARVILARRNHIAATHETWPPALAIGLVTGAAGLPWAPLPVVKADGKDAAKVHLAAPITLAALSALLFVESVWLHTPVTESWAVAALIMSASTLLPIGPLDGAQLGKAGVLAATGVIGGALLVGLGVI
jgi:tetratricopeptide (TPR) repeat protein